MSSSVDRQRAEPDTTALPSAERQLWVWYSPHGLGGVETFLQRIAQELVRRGVQVWVAGIQSLDGPSKGRYEGTGVRVLDWIDFYPAFMRRVPQGPVCEWLSGEVASIQPTLIALNGCSDFAAGVAPLLRRLRPFCTIHETFHVDAPDDQFFDLRASYLDILDGVASSSTRMFDRFHGRFPRYSDLPTRYIPYGVIVPDRPRDVPGDRLRLLYVGRLVQEQKRILLLPEILEGLRARNRSFDLTVIGNGPDAERFQAELARRELAASVRLLGFVPPEEITDHYLTHDVLVNVSDYEGFSISVLEALAAGCVPVCTDLPGRDHAALIDGVTCRLCPIEDLGRMSEILAALTPAELAKLSTGARQVGAQFTVANMTDAYQEFARDLRQRRPLRRWPVKPWSVLRGAWDLSRYNPWIPHPNPIGKLARTVRGFFSSAR